MTAGRHRGSLAALLLLAMAATAAPAATPMAGAVERVVLGNGLTVLLLPEPGSGLVSVGMMYKVGAKNEAAGTTGLAHYAEHMNFRATARFPRHEITEAITRLGGRWSGYTWIDQTFFQTTLAKDELALALDIEADRMGGALYYENEFAQERSSVIAELRSYDDPHSLLYDEVLGAALLVHPYRNNTIGWLTDVEAETRDVAFGFYRRFYTPRNAVLVVGGDFERNETIRQIEARFGARPRGEADTHVATVEPPQSGERRVVVRKPGGHAEVLLAFPAPALDDPDFPTMVLFDALLAGGKGLWFLRSYAQRPETPLEQAVVASGAGLEARSAFQASRYPYVYTLRATTPSGERLEAAEKALFAAVAKATRSEWTAADLAQARREVRAGVARDLDSLAGRVHQLAFFEVAGGYEHLANLDDRLEAIDSKAVRVFARTRLARDKVTVGWFWPTPGVAAFASGQASVGSVGATTGPATGATAPEVRSAAAPTTFRLANGLTVHFASSPGSRLVAVRGRIDAGPVYETHPGVAALAARLFAGAASAPGAPPLVFGLDEDPADMANARYIAFQGSGLPEDLGTLARALASGFRASRAGFDDARREALESARGAEADLETSLAARARSSLFAPGLPLARPPWGAKEDLGSADLAVVMAFFSRFVVPARAELSIAGGVVAAEVRRQLDAAFADAPSPAVHGVAVAPPRLPEAHGPAAWTVSHLSRPDASQNTIEVVIPGDRSRPHDPAATSLLLYLLGETFYSGRLGRALVEPGLVYSVQATLEEAPGLPGYLRVRTAAARENTAEVLGRIRSVLEEAGRGAFTAAELEEAKGYLRGKAARAGDGALAVAARALETAVPSATFETVTLEQLNDTARRLTSRGAPLALVGGPGE